MFITLSGNLAYGIENVCTISADLSGLSGALKQRRGSDGTYWTLTYKVGIQFGGTELQAYLEWREDVSASVPEFGLSLTILYTETDAQEPGSDHSEFVDVSNGLEFSCRSQFRRRIVG